MPQVQILDRQPSFGENFAAGLGQGLKESLSSMLEQKQSRKSGKAIGEHLKGLGYPDSVTSAFEGLPKDLQIPLANMTLQQDAKKMATATKNREYVGKNLSKALTEAGHGATPETLGIANQLLEQGIARDGPEAVQMTLQAVDSGINPFQQQQGQQGQQGQSQGMMGQNPEGGVFPVLQEAAGTPLEQGQQGRQPNFLDRLLGMPDVSEKTTSGKKYGTLPEDIIKPIKEARQKIREAPKDQALLNKPIDDLKGNEIFKVPEERIKGLNAKDKFKYYAKVAKAYGMTALGPAVNKVFPGAEQFAKEQGAIPEEELGLEGVKKITGGAAELGRFYVMGRFLGFGPTGLATTGLATSSVDEINKVLDGTTEGFDAAMKHIGSETGMGLALGTATKIVESVASRIPAIRSKIAEIIEKGKAPPESKIGTSVKAPEPIHADAATKAKETIYNNVAKRAIDEGVDLNAAAKGKAIPAKQLQKLVTEEADAALKGRVTSGSNKDLHRGLGLEVKVAQPGEAIAEREATSKTLQKEPSMLEKQLEPEELPGLGSKPETQAKRRGIRARAENEERIAQERLNTVREEMNRMQRNLKHADATTRAELEKGIATREKQASELEELILDARHEQKYFTKRQRLADLEKQATETAERIKTQAFEGSEEFYKDAKRQLELEQKFLEREEALLKRGELPHDATPDTFQNVQKAYTKQYNAMLRQMEDYERSLLDRAKEVGKEGVAGELKKARDTIDFLKARLRAQEAKLRLQRDRRLTQKATEGAKGAFTRNDVLKAAKEAKVANTNLQEAIFKVEKAIPGEKNVAEIAKKAIEANPQIAKKVKAGEPLTKAEAEQVLKATGLSKEEIDEIGSVAKKAIEDGVKAGKTESQILKDFAAKNKGAEKPLPKNAAGKVSQDELEEAGKIADLSFKKQEKRKKALKIAGRILRSRTGQAIIFPLLSVGGATTIPGFIKDVHVKSYGSDFKKAKELRSRNPSAGAKEVLRLRREMKEKGYSKPSIERAELIGGIRNN